MPMPTLPIDIILILFKYLGVKDVMQLRQTCKDFLEIIQLRTVWLELLQIHVIQQSLPIPRLAGRDLAALSAKELETCLVDALRLRRNWTSASPRAVNRRTFKTVSDSQAQVVSMSFLPGRGHRWLISLTLSTGNGRRVFTVQCWDLLASSTCVARRTLSDMRGLRVNTDPTHPGVALKSSTGIEILGIDFSANNPESAFIRLQTLDSVDESLILFTTSTILTKFDGNRLHLRAIGSPEFTVELQNPGHLEQKECIDAIISETYAIVVRTNTLDLYALASFRSGSGARVIEPVAFHTWQWRIDSVSLAYQPSQSAAARGAPAPLNLLVRYASLFPWPVNALHHYVLPCDEFYDPEWGIDANNKPYLTNAVLIRTFASPIRLFARSDMVLGSYGTALWIDSHTEDYFDHAVEGQRLAGTLFTTHEPGEPVLGLNDLTSAAIASMVYEVREDDGWVRIAVQEEEGKIALGTASAEITLLEYI